ncbi:MAG: hypothetical protein QOH21_990 [Acidobacteriota bacterium]|nr:hypothetical protein [Acidobacteriota bacterium]
MLSIRFHDDSAFSLIAAAEGSLYNPQQKSNREKENK